MENPTKMDDLGGTHIFGNTRWWQLKYLFIFTPKIGEDEPILTVRIFFKGVGKKPPTRGSGKNSCPSPVSKNFVPLIFFEDTIWQQKKFLEKNISS